MACRTYCAVFGCMNSSLMHPEMTFFKLPANCERRLLWLQLIHREDLENKPFTSYRVCEKHFGVEDVLQSTNRKRLLKNTLPSLMLPSSASIVPEVSLKEDKQTQTALLVGDGNCTQSAKTTKEISSQTPISACSNTLKIKKLKNELLQCRKKIKSYERQNKKAEENTFHRLCDKFLSDKLALLIKAQSRLKKHGKGNRYDKDYVTYCSNLYCVSPQAYRFLKSALCLPCPSTLDCHSIPNVTEHNE